MTSLSNTLSAGFVAMCIASGFGSAQAASVEAGTLTCDLHDRVEPGRLFEKPVQMLVQSPGARARRSPTRLRSRISVSIWR